MIELMILACLAGEPTTCEAFHLPFQAPMTMQECTQRGPLSVVDWASHHPRWQIKGWRCQLPGA